ncbi:MAG: sensor histidine kinase [Flavobacteriales bacterium]
MNPYIKNILVALFIAFFTSLIVYFIHNQYFKINYVPYAFFWLIIAACFTIPSIILAKALDFYFPWGQSKNRLWITIFMNLVLITFLSIIISYYQVKWLENPSITWSEYMEDGRSKIVFYGLMATLFSFFFHAKGFYEALVKSNEREIMLIEEKKETELKALKAQMDPHFLFNNLNVLYALIDENPPKAQEFVAKLSKVYRYVLEAKDKKTISLKEEVDFAKQYFGLLEKRFEMAIRLEIKLEDLKKKIVPLTLQTALENAVKHNDFTEEKPLIIKIFEKKNSLFIENNCQKKEVHYCGKTGLKNLSKCYELLGNLLEVEQTNEIFRLKVPLL